MIEKIQLQMDPGRLQQNMGRYADLAVEMGATAAVIVPSHAVIADERVRMKCRHPLCSVYGRCMNCPPNTGTVEETREQIKLFKYAIAIKLDVASDRVIGRSAVEEGGEDLRLLCKIISAVESAAYYDGYYFATGFSSGSCSFIWCKGQECQALQGKGCRYQARSYASMEAVGIDVFRLAAFVGWDIYPVGTAATADMIPHASRCGLILID